jgi:hypothetical protein
MGRYGKVRVRMGRCMVVMYSRFYVVRHGYAWMKWYG